MSLPYLPFLPDFRKENVDAEDQLIAFVKAVLKWKLEHEKLDETRDSLFNALINEHAKLRKDVRAFFEWFESIPDIMDYLEEGSHPYDEKKKALLEPSK